ncbi:MAG TPA: hypothetical protein VMT53_24795 [Terriglobales bacterium]|nr:hypothetical protein [Terriglobales bacterium]
MAIEHLSDDQWAEMLMPRDAGSEHLSECAHCRGQRDQLQTLLSTLPQAARSATEHPDVFWEAQRLAIQSRISVLPNPAKRTARLAWGAALVLIFIASLILRTGSHAPIQGVASDPDRELMVQVEQALDGDVPQALQPASLLADEINQAAHEVSTSPKSKEKTP